MKLTLDNLKQSGAFTGGPVKREVEWESNDKTHKADVWVRPLSYHTTMADAKAIQRGGDILAYRLSTSICDEEGFPIFTIADITGRDEEGKPIMVKDDDGNMVERGALCKELSDALISLVNEVSGLGKISPKKN